MKTNQDLPTEPASARRNALQKGFIAGFIILALLIVAALIILPRLNIKSLSATRNIGTPTPANPAPMDAAPALGPKTAPVTIVEYADFGCPSCWYWYKQDTLNQLRSKYGDKIRFVWRDYAVITLLSPAAAEAGQCANDQGKFWEFHDAVYGNGGAITASDLNAYAAKIGLNMNQFNECISTHRYHDRVLAEQTEAFTYGYNGAPFFLVNKQLVVGPQSLSFFSSLIDPILAAGK